MHQRKFPLYVHMAKINTEPVQAHQIESFGIWTYFEYMYIHHTSWFPAAKPKMLTFH